jgi:creatinine amidohydrolase
MAMRAGGISWEEFGDSKTKPRPPAMLVFGAIEPHGKHLPLDTDSVIPQEIARRIESGLGEGILLFPPVNYGYVYTLRGFPGAISLTSRTLQAVAEDIFSELCREGFTRFVVLSGHGGNTGPIKCALKELSDDYDFRAAVIEWWKLTDVEAGHADRVEASLVLAAGHKLRAEPVQEARRNYSYAAIPTPPDLFTPSGYIGSVEGISAELGEKVYNEVTERIKKIISDDLLSPDE